jgi:hypothetical protein
MSYAEVARGDGGAPRFLRLPSWVAGPNLPKAAPLLPLRLDDVAVGDPSVFFSVRLRDAFRDVVSLWNGERGYIRAALSRAERVWVVPSPSRDPILLLSSFSGAPLDLRTLVSRVTFLEAPVVENISFDLPKEMFFVVQTFSGTLSEQHPVLKRSVSEMYKNYQLLSVPKGEIKETKHLLTSLSKSGQLCYFPRETLLSGDLAKSMVQIRLDHVDQLVAAKACASFAPHVFLQGRYTIRMFFPSPVAPPLFEELCKIPGVAEAFVEDQSLKWRKPRDKTDLVVIKRTDNNPISEEAADVVAKVLGITSVSLRCGALLGKLLNASMYHEKVVGGVFSVRWLGAPSSPVVEAESDDPPGGTEEGPNM